MIVFLVLDVLFQATCRLTCVCITTCHPAGQTVMHLSNVKSQQAGGSSNLRGFDCEVCPQGGDFDRTRYPQDGEFDMITILDNEEGLEINL